MRGVVVVSKAGILSGYDFLDDKMVSIVVPGYAVCVCVCVVYSHQHVPGSRASSV